MRIAGGQNPASQILQRGMPRNALHQPLAQPAAAMALEYKHIADLRDGGKIADHSGEANLCARPVVNAETECMLNRPRDNFPRNAIGPVAVCQKPVNYIQTQAFAVGADKIFAAPVFHHHFGISPANVRHATFYRFIAGVGQPAAAGSALTFKRGPEK